MKMIGKRDNLEKRRIGRRDILEREGLVKGII